MKNIILLALLTLTYGTVQAQSAYKISFATAKDTLTKSKSNFIIHRIELKTENTNNAAYDGYSISVEPDNQKTSLPPSNYSLDTRALNFASVQASNYIYITVQKDSIPDRIRSLVLAIKIKKKDGSYDSPGKNEGEIRELELVVKGVEDNALSNGFNYLAYVGTNFDLVDGIKAKNLFFAANVFLPPVPKSNKVGAYLSLYGNRTMTTSDSSSNVRFTTKHVRISDTSYWRYTTQTDMKVSRVSDNLGAYISPLIKLWGASKASSSIKLYYSPSLEFVWRRTETSYSFSNERNGDSTLTTGSSETLEFSKNRIQYANEFSFNVGLLGFFIVHESKEISMRVYMSTGYSSNYYPEQASSLKTDNNNNYKQKPDIFFCGRAWITEATTGITLQAEITNTLIHPRPFYGVTLSKAFSFKNLGTIFQPITSR